MNSPNVTFKTFSVVLALGFLMQLESKSEAAESPPAKELSAFEKSLQMNENISTKETIVQLGGRKFRRVEFKSDIFYLQLQSDLATNAELSLLCGERPQEFGPNSAPMITAAVRVTKRTRFFIEGLRRMCLGAGNTSRIDLAPDIAVGFMLDDDPKGVLKNRRISINPISPALNFSAEW